MNDSKAKVYLAIVGLLGMVAMFLYTIYTPTPDSYTYGTIAEKRLVARGAASTVAYTIDGKSYNSYIGMYRNYPVGEKFLCYFNHKWPNHGRVIQEAPIFLESERTAMISAVVRQSGSSTIFFEYVVDGRPYERWQVVDGKLNLSQGDTIEVAYWIKDPQRAIIPSAYDQKARSIISTDERFKAF